MEAFCWLIPLPQHINDFLASVLIGRPFGGTKKIMWLALIRAFSGYFGVLKMVGFSGKFLTLSITFWNLFSLLLSFGAKLNFSLVFYSLSYLVSNWRYLLRFTYRCFEFLHLYFINFISYINEIFPVQKNKFYNRNHLFNGYER